MIFAYMRDGTRVDLPDAVSVVHGQEVTFLDPRGEVLLRVPAEAMIAYSRVRYEEDRAIREGALTAPEPRHRRSPASSLQ